MGKIFKKKNIKYYLIFYLIVEILMGFVTTRMLFTTFIEIIKVLLNSPDFVSALKSIFLLLIILFAYFMTIVFLTAPVTIYLLAKKSADITQEIQNRKYNSKDDIIYFREKLEDISPTTISIMQNLKVEDEKDIAATLMKLQLNKNIKIEGDTITVLSEDVTDLTSSEKQLFYMIADKKINRMQIEAWKVAAIGEAKSQGYIREQNTKKSLKIVKLILVGILIIFGLGAKTLYPKIEEYDYLIQKIELEYPEEVQDEMPIYELVNQKWFDTYIEAMIILVTALSCMIGILFWPIFYFVYTRRYKNKNNSLKRTTKGEELTEIIYAMKRFIHDFSRLDTATKEEIILWDDFFIYAIVLEENENVVDEILNFKDIKNISTQNLIK